MQMQWIDKHNKGERIFDTGKSDKPEPTKKKILTQEQKTAYEEMIKASIPQNKPGKPTKTINAPRAVKSVKKGI